MTTTLREVQPWMREVSQEIMNWSYNTLARTPMTSDFAQLIANACPAPVLPSVLKSSMDWLDGWCREIPQDHACIKHIQALLTAFTQQQATIEQQREEVERLKDDRWQMGIGIHQHAESREKAEDERDRLALENDGLVAWVEKAKQYIVTELTCCEKAYDNATEHDLPQETRDAWSARFSAYQDIQKAFAESPQVSLANLRRRVLEEAADELAGRTAQKDHWMILELRRRAASLGSNEKEPT